MIIDSIRADLGRNLILKLSVVNIDKSNSLVKFMEIETS